MTSMARIVSLAILTTLIIFLGITFYQIIAPFLLPLFLAAVTAVWCQPLYGYFLKKLKQKRPWAAAATTGTVLLALFVPLVFGVFSAAMQLLSVTTKPETGARLTAVVQKLQAHGFSEVEGHEKVRKLATAVLDRFDPLPANDADAESLKQAQIRREQTLDDIDQRLSQATEDAGEQLQSLAMKSLGIAASSGLNLTGKTFGMLSAAVGLMIGLTMFLIALYYFLCDGSELMSATEKLIPIQVEYQRQLIQEFNRVMQAVVTATMLSAIAQGAATSAMLFLVGFHSFFLLFVVGTFASLIPIAGTWMVWGPFAAWLAYQGSWGSAIFLAIVGIAVIGTMDNVIKAYVLQNDTSLHPLLAFVSVFGAMQVMGLWGIFIGPIVACCLHTLVKIFNAELNEFSKDSLSAAAAANDDTQKIPELATAPIATPASARMPETPKNG